MKLCKFAKLKEKSRYFYRLSLFNYKIDLSHYYLAKNKNFNHLVQIFYKIITEMLI